MGILTTFLPSLIKEGFGWLTRKQDRKETARKLKGQWEVAQLERTPWFVSVIAAVHILGPIDYAFYLAWQSALPIESPDDVADVVSTTLNAFPSWWTGAAVSILLAMWGIRANGQAKVDQSRAKEREHKAEAERNRTAAAKELQQRKAWDAHRPDTPR